MQQVAEEMTSRNKAQQPQPLGISREMLLDFTTFHSLLKESKAMHNGKQAGLPKVPPVPSHHDWQIVEHICDGKTGWEGALLHAEVNGVDYYALYHEGANDMVDIQSVRALYGGEAPPQLMAAQEAIYRWNGMIAERQQGKRSVIMDVGYSLGGVVCSLTSTGRRPCVVFDCPSPAALYEKMGINECDRNRNKITVLSPHASYFNANGPHYGQILIAGEKFWDFPKKKRVGLRHFAEMSKHSHNINRIGHALAAEKDWDFRPACEIFSGNKARPDTIFRAVQEFVEDSKQHRSRQSFTEKLFSRLVDKEARKGPEAADKFFAKLAKWMGRSSILEKAVTEKILGRKAVVTPAESWISRSCATPSPQTGRGV